MDVAKTYGTSIGLPIISDGFTQSTLEHNKKMYKHILMYIHFFVWLYKFLTSHFEKKYKTANSLAPGTCVLKSPLWDEVRMEKACFRAKKVMGWGCYYLKDFYRYLPALIDYEKWDTFLTV